VKGREGNGGEKEEGEGEGREDPLDLLPSEKFPSYATVIYDVRAYTARYKIDLIG